MRGTMMNLRLRLVASLLLFSTARLFACRPDGSTLFARRSVHTEAFTMRADDLAVLLIRRNAEPFKGCWALPGGFVNENESLDRAAVRELHEETGLTVSTSKLEQLGAFGSLDGRIARRAGARRWHPARRRVRSQRIRRRRRGTRSCWR